jgi:hypothetical protein
MLSAPHSTCRAASPPTGFLSDYVETRVPCQIRRFGRSGRALRTRLGSRFNAGQRRNLKRKFLDMENAIRPLNQNVRAQTRQGLAAPNSTRGCAGCGR